MPTILFSDMGIIDYQLAWDYQEKLLQKNVTTKLENKNNPIPVSIPNYLLFVEHPHVYTIGKSGNTSHLLLNDTELKTHSATFYTTNRGGDITYHGPGQIVGYPILDLEQFNTDINWYLRSLEEVIILTLANYGIKSERSRGETGVWIDVNTSKARKICAFGIKCSRWITMHGWGFNVNSNLNYFNNIIPCGIQNKSVTSMQEELGEEVDIAEVKQKLLTHFSTIFNCSFQSYSKTII